MICSYCILSSTGLSVPNFLVLHPMVVEILQSGPKWWTGQPTDPHCCVTIVIKNITCMGNCLFGFPKHYSIIFCSCLLNPSLFIMLILTEHVLEVPQCYFHMYCVSHIFLPHWHIFLRLPNYVNFNLIWQSQATSTAENDLWFIFLTISRHAMWDKASDSVLFAL